jgi:hypothetical protein
VGQYATDYYDVTELVADGRLALSFAGEPSVGLLDAAPGAPGEVWWSGRNDNGDSRLTRALDLRQALAPRLGYRMWYDLEENWDYAYVLVSDDGGQTWRRLAPPGATDANPNGNGYGSGLTGASEGWQAVSLDLGAYAGQEILLRFEVVTDDAVSLSGLALDALRIEDGERAQDLGEPADWRAEGFTRIDPALPQRWLLRAVIDHGEGLEVKRFAVDNDGRAALRLDEIPADARLTVLVSGLTPGSRHPAGYSLGPPPAGMP